MQRRKLFNDVLAVDLAFDLRRSDTFFLFDFLNEGLLLVSEDKWSSDFEIRGLFLKREIMLSFVDFIIVTLIFQEQLLEERW